MGPVRYSGLCVRCHGNAYRRLNPCTRDGYEHKRQAYAKALRAVARLKRKELKAFRREPLPALPDSINWLDGLLSDESENEC